MGIITGRILVVILVLLSLPVVAAKKTKKQTRHQKKAKATATPTPTPTPTPRLATLLWGEARVGMTVDEVLRAFPGKAEAAAEGGAASEDGTYTGATLREAQVGESSFGVSFAFRSPGKTLERVTLACTECYASDFSKVRRVLIEKYGNPALDEAPSRDRRRTVWIADGLKIQLGWVYSNPLGRAIKVLSVNYVEAEKAESGKE